MSKILKIHREFRKKGILLEINGVEYNNTKINVDFSFSNYKNNGILLLLKELYEVFKTPISFFNIKDKKYLKEKYLKELYDENIFDEKTQIYINNRNIFFDIDFIKENYMSQIPLTIKKQVDGIIKQIKFHEKEIKKLEEEQKKLEKMFFDYEYNI